MIMRWSNVQTNEYDLQAKTYPTICTLINCTMLMKTNSWLGEWHRPWTVPPLSTGRLKVSRFQVYWSATLPHVANAQVNGSLNPTLLKLFDKIMISSSQKNIVKIVKNKCKFTLLPMHIMVIFMYFITTCLPSRMGKIILWMSKKFYNHIEIVCVTCPSNLKMGMQKCAMKS